MNDYSIYVENGEIIGDSVFYSVAYDMLSEECKRLSDFTESLDKDPIRKKEKIAEYKCAKFRYATVSLIHSVIYNNNKFRKQRNLEASHYLLPAFDDFFMAQTEYLPIFDSAPINESPDFSLYYGVLCFTDKELTELLTKLQNANDFEKIELEERIEGLKFAKDCLNKAWQRRKEVTM